MKVYEISYTTREADRWGDEPMRKLFMSKEKAIAFVDEINAKESWINKNGITIKYAKYIGEIEVEE